MPNSLVDNVTEQLLAQDRELLSHTKYPIVTVSGSFRDALEITHQVSDDIDHPDITLSRAHFSMALGVAVQAWGSDTPDPKKAWLVEPTNYISRMDWGRVALTETVGRLMARNDLLGWVKKNVLDQNRKKKFPLTDSITSPLLHVTEAVEKPIISMHIVAGNLLAQAGKKVVQVVTDPHVREDYVQYAHLPNMTFCVFDENTRYEFFAVAAAHGKAVDPNRVVVTGPPIDPRIIATRENKKADSWKRRPLRILLTTGGLGTNKEELRSLLKQLLPMTRKKNGPVQLVYYAGTNRDHAKMVTKLAAELKVPLGELSDKRAPLRLLCHDDIVDANNLLILYGFPWADVVFCKPSGDMAYDAAAAGCAMLFLEPWGEWELNIREVFVQLGIALPAEVDDIAEQLMIIRDTELNPTWLARALERAQLLPPHFLHGAQNILNVARRL